MNDKDFNRKEAECLPFFNFIPTIEYSNIQNREQKRKNEMLAKNVLTKKGRKSLPSKVAFFLQGRILNQEILILTEKMGRAA